MLENTFILDYSQILTSFFQPRMNANYYEMLTNCPGVPIRTCPRSSVRSFFKKTDTRHRHGADSRSFASIRGKNKKSQQLMNNLDYKPAAVAGMDDI